MAMGDGVGRTGLHAVSAKNAPRIINVVHAGIAFACRDAPRFGIFGSFDVDASSRTSRGAEKATNAFFETIFVALQNVNAAIARLEMHRLVGVILRGALSPKIAKGNTEALGESGDRAADFFQKGSHDSFHPAAVGCATAKGAPVSAEMICLP